MAEKLLQDGKGIKVLGSINIDSKEHFICDFGKLYKNGILIPYVVIPKHKFDVFKHEMWVEVIKNEQVVHPREVSENSSSAVTEIQSQVTT